MRKGSSEKVDSENTESYWERNRLNVLFVTQEGRAGARKPRDAAAILFGIKFADDIHYKFKSSKASKARIQSSKHIGAKQNSTQFSSFMRQYLENARS